MNWNRSIILIVSVVCLAGVVRLARACADTYDPYESASFFLNMVHSNKALIPFYYVSDQAFYSADDNEGKAMEYQPTDLNPEAWRAYTGKRATIADIDSFLYVFSKEEVTAVYDHIKQGTPLKAPEKVSKNSFTKWLISNNETEVAKYLVFAKSCEPYTVPLEAVWNNKTSDYETPKRDSAAMSKLIAEAIKRYDALKDNELKLRYAYQAARLSFYSRQYMNTVTLFDNMVVRCEENFLYYRCLALKAGGLYKMGKKNEAAYLYCVVFDKAKEDKRPIYTSFRWATNGDVDGVAPLCRNDHERAVLYMMNGLYEYDMNERHMVTALKQAYKYDPKVKGLDVVMTRDINRIESGRIRGMSTGKNTNDTELNELNAFARGVALEGRSGDPAFWLLCAAYTYILEGDAANCKKYLIKANSEKMTAVEEEQMGIVNVLYVMLQNGKITPATEERLLPLFRDMETKSKTNRRCGGMFGDMMTMVMREAYMAQGDTIKAIYCFSRAASVDRYNSWSYMDDYTDEPGKMLEAMRPEQLQNVEAFINKKNKTPYESWLTSATSYTPSALYELEGTKYIRMYKFDKAVETLKKAPDSLLKKTELPDIMVSHILDGQEWNKTDMAVKYSKLQFAQKMVELRQALKNNPTDGRAAYQYANALYNMSYYGKAHHAYDYYRSSVDDYAYFAYKSRGKLADYEQERYNVHTPERYYVQAYENSPDREMKARCLFMAAKCWQKNCVPIKEDEYYNSVDELTYYNYTFKNPYLQKLKGDFGDTKFYGTARSTCSYFRDYVKKK